jgi:hypothetical protein
MKQQQPGSLAAAFSFHPDPAAKEDPRFQRNNTLNAAGMLGPQEMGYGTPYGDSRVGILQPGLTLTNAQQQVLNRPGLRTPPGMPGYGLQPEQAMQGDELAKLTTQLPMSQSQVSDPGDPQVAMRQGIGKPMENQPPQRKGMNTGFRWKNQRRG